MSLIKPLIPPNTLPDFPADRFGNQEIAIAWRAEESLVQRATGTGTSTWVSSVEGLGGWTDTDKVRAILDAGSSLGMARQASNSQRPAWRTTTSSGAAQALEFDRTAITNLQFLDSDGTALDWLFGDEDKTLVFRLALTEDPAVTGVNHVIAGCQFGTSGGGWAIYHSTGSGDLEFRVREGGAASQAVGYTWSGFAVDTLYTLAFQHTAGGSTSIFIDDLGTPVATDTLTNWNTLSPTDITYIGTRGSESDPISMELIGFAWGQAVWSQSEMRTWENWMKEVE